MTEIKALVIIPAKADSKRLIGKNKRVIAGLTLLEHSIIYAQKSKLVNKIIVSTEDKETKDIAKTYGVDVIDRDNEYMGEREVADVYISVFKTLNNFDYTHIVGVQPDHPDRNVSLDKMLMYAVENKYDDFFTVNSDGSRNGSVRIIKSDHVATGKVSRRVGSMFDNCTNIHTETDLRNAERNINERLH